MYQEETYEPNDDEAREAAQLADEEARWNYEAALQQQTLWAGTPREWTAVDIFRDLAIGMARAQAVASNGVRPSPARVGFDGLQIRKVHDRQQNDDAHADGNDVGDSRRSQRDQERQCGLGAISGGTERVQAKDGNTRGDAYPFTPLGARGERLSQ